MNLFRSLRGLMEVEITGADLPGTLAAMTGKDIPVFYAQRQGELTLNLTIRRNDIRKLHTICENRGESIRILHRQGLYWTGKALFSRPILWIGLLSFLILLLYLPTRVLFIRVEGNRNVPANLILETAENCGIGFGASRREVRSERMKNTLLEKMPQLQWAGVNTSGCVAVISVRERTDPDRTQKEASVSSIIAAMDGIVTSCTATGGNLLCVPGQAVKAGEILISGYTDCGLTIQATRAEGEVFAQTIRKFRAVCPSYCYEVLSTGYSERGISLIIGKKRINLRKGSGISTPSCGRMYEEYYVTLPGNFILPIGIGVDVYIPRQTQRMELEKAQAETLLKDFSQSCLHQQMVAGKILSCESTLVTEQDRYRLEGKYLCTEMIGKVQQEQIGEHYGENQ